MTLSKHSQLSLMLNGHVFQGLQFWSVHPNVSHPTYGSVLFEEFLGRWLKINFATWTSPVWTWLQMALVVYVRDRTFTSIVFKSVKVRMTMLKCHSK